MLGELYITVVRGRGIGHDRLTYILQITFESGLVDKLDCLFTFIILHG